MGGGETLPVITFRELSGSEVRLRPGLIEVVCESSAEPALDAVAVGKGR